MEFIEEFIGFYMRKGFWVDQRLDLRSYRDARRLCGAAAEIAFTYECEAFKAAITVEGMLMLHCRDLAASRPSMGDPKQLEEALNWWEKFLDYAYALQVFLESESICREHPFEIVVGEVTPDNSTTVGLFDWAPITSSRNGGRIISEDVRDLNRYVAFVAIRDKVPESFDFDPFAWPEISRMTLESALQKFEIAVTKPAVIKWLAFIARSKIAHSKNDFSISFLHNWFVIESACKEMYYNATVSEVPTEKESKAAMGHILKTLKSQGALTQKEFAVIGELKERRNTLMHQPHKTICRPADCALAGQLALDLAVRGLDLNIVLSWGCGVRF